MSSKKYSQTLRDAKSFRVAPEITPSLAIDFLESLDCPRALSVAILLRNKEFEQLVKLDFNPDHYLTVNDLRDAYAATNFLSKFKDFSLPYDLDEVAFEKFEKFESQCKHTNDRFMDLANDPLYRGVIVELHGAVQRKIAKILGDFNAEEFFSLGDWGPGATTLIKGNSASSTNKYLREVGITRDLFDLVSNGKGVTYLTEVYPQWGFHLLEAGFPHFEVGNKVITVPKNAKTNRVIAVEPGINLWFQKSIGDMISRRLLRWGIDLRDQTRNQELARSGSVTSELATIDFSSASDSISKRLVEELLPRRWFLLLDASRSHFGWVKGELRLWNKFSSMGNGFTFPLETLIFYSCALVVREHLRLDGKVSAFGDDVIIPSAAYDLFSRLCTFYGFSVNPDKSFHLGFFRESCGSHFYRGRDIKPIYLKENVTTVQACYKLANSVRELCHRRNNYFGCDIRFERLFNRLRRLVPKSTQLLVPRGVGDCGFVSNLDEAAPTVQRATTHQSTKWIEGYFVAGLFDVARSHQVDHIGLLLDRLWGLRHSEDSFTSRLDVKGFGLAISRRKLRNLHKGNYDVYRGRTKKRVIRFLVRQWPDLGPWL